MMHRHINVHTKILNILSRTISHAIIILTLFAPFGAHGNNVCDTGSSLLNPLASAQSGIGGTGTKISQSGIGGTGAKISQSGIGGTGIDNGSLGNIGNIVDTNGKMAQNGGIGGTGERMTEDGGIGGTGIFGIITGFASICVNGIEIHYTADTPVTMDASPSTLMDLATGQIVAIRAKGFGDVLTAKHIAIMHAAVGPITHIDHTSQRIQVLDQTIQLSADDNLEKLNTGTWVRVSGHRLADGTVAASHIQSIQPLALSKINGRITQINFGELVVDGTRVEFDPQSQPTGLSEGMEISIKGHWDGAHIHAQTIQIDPTRHSLGNVEHIVLEGYVHAIDEQTLRINSRNINIKQGAEITGLTQETLQQNQRIQIFGHLTDDNRIVADKIELKHSPFIQDIDVIHFENNNRHSNNTEQTSEDDNTQDASGKAKFRQNMQPGHQDLDNDADSSKSSDASKDLKHEKSEQHEDLPKNSDTIKDFDEQFDEVRDTDTSGKSIDHDDSKKDFSHADHKDYGGSNLVNTLQDQDQNFNHSLNTDHDLDHGIVENHDLNLGHEQFFDGDYDGDYDIDFDRDFDRDFNNGFDLDFDR